MILLASRRLRMNAIAIVAATLLLGCTESRPRKTLRDMATADGYHGTTFQTAMRLAGSKEIRAFFAAWGTVSSNYDMVVLDEIYFRSGQADASTEELAVVCDRISHLPTLKWQMAWHFCNTHYPITRRPVHETTCLRLLHDDLFGKERNEWAKLYYLTAIGSLVGLHDVVDEPKVNELDVRWRRLEEWLRENMDQLRFNEEIHLFEHCVPGKGNCPSIRYWPFPEAQYESRI